VSDLIDRLADAAAAALEDLGPVIEHELPKLRGVVLELTLANGGSIVECDAWVARRANIHTGRRCRADSRTEATTEATR